MNYDAFMKQAVKELEMRRSSYLHTLNYIFDKKDYNNLSPSKKLDVIAIVRAFSKLLNRFDS